MAVAYIGSDTLTGIRTPLWWTPLMRWAPSGHRQVWVGTNRPMVLAIKRAQSLQAAAYVAVGERGRVMLQRFYVHGNRGVVEYPDRTDWIYRRGWGLDLNLKGQEINYVHFPMQIQLTNYVTPFEFGRNCNQLYEIHLTLTAENGLVSVVHIYDGYEHLVAEDVQLGPCDKKDFLIQAGGSDGLKVHVGLGITLKIETADSHPAKFSFHSVGYLAKGPSEDPGS